LNPEKTLDFAISGKFKDRSFVIECSMPLEVAEAFMANSSREYLAELLVRKYLPLEITDIQTKRGDDTRESSSIPRES